MSELDRWKAQLDGTPPPRFVSCTPQTGVELVIHGDVSQDFENVHLCFNLQLMNH